LEINVSAILPNLRLKALQALTLGTQGTLGIQGTFNTLKAVNFCKLTTYCFLISGRNTEKVVPRPGSDFTCIFPLWLSIIP
jgi:hypothetical protein